VKEIDQEIINSKDDVLKMLDYLMEQREGDWWDDFYKDREKDIPFFKNVPDENLTQYIENSYLTPGKTLEIGCGPGRNAIYLAKEKFTVDAIDFSEDSIKWALKRMKQADVTVNFQSISFFDFVKPAETYDFIYDSGVLHHIKPHRRFEYLNKVWKLLKPGGNFGLVCFNLKGGANISDYDVYRELSMKGGLGFSEYKLKEVLKQFFEIIEFREMDRDNTGDVFGEDFLWTVLMRKSNQ